MKIETIPLSKLTPAPWNPRKISDGALARLRKSIEAFDLVEPIIWNKRSGRVVGDVAVRRWQNFTGKLAKNLTRPGISLSPENSLTA